MMKQVMKIGMLVLALAWIWGNSLLPGDVSAQLSDAAIRMTTSALGRLGIYAENFDLAAALLRKLAHFAEFWALGLAATFLFWDSPKKNRVSMSLLFGLVVGLLDETIQMFRPGRTADIADVWLDFFGFSFGLITFFLLLGCFYLLRNAFRGGEPRRRDRSSPDKSQRNQPHHSEPQHNQQPYRSGSLYKESLRSEPRRHHDIPEP